MSRPIPRYAHPLTQADVQRAPLEFLAELARDYGDIVQYSLGDWNVVFLNRPAYVQHVVQERHRIYGKLGTPDLMMLKPMLGDGLLTTDGDVWMEQRRMSQPAFHRARIDALGDLIASETAKTLDGWSAAAADGTRVELTDDLTQLTTRVVARAMFGADVSHVVTTFGDAVQAMNEFMGHYDPTDRARYERFRRARGLIDVMVQEIIATRRLDEAQDHGDFLSILLAARDAAGEPLSARAIRDQVLTVLMAGHETTAKALTWTTWLLDRHPDVARRVRADVRSVLGGRTPRVDDLPALPFVWQVLQESMRLYPPVWIMSRRAVADDEIDGYEIPAGTLTVVSQYVLHRHPKVWTAPEEFRPERFAAESAEGKEPFAYFPFSGGPRQCIGKHFATIELQIVLTMLLQRYRVTVVPSHPVEPEALVTLRPRHGLPVTLTHAEDAGDV